jgi:hypothetical protein
VRNSREQIRRSHSRRNGHCAACGEPDPCTVTKLLTEVEQIEGTLRDLLDNWKWLQVENEALRAKISRAETCLADHESSPAAESWSRSKTWLADNSSATPAVVR